MELADRARHRFGLFAGASLGVFLVAYLALDTTVAGQAWSDQAYLGSALQPAHARRLDNQFLEHITVLSTGLTCLLLLAIGAVRRLPLNGLVAAIGLCLAALSAEMLKVVLPHPDLATGFEELMQGKAFQTFPSGHSTIATATTLGLLLVSSRRWQPPIAIIGTLLVTLVAAGTVAAAWHRPGDALGGIALACTVQGLLAWALFRRVGRPVSPSGRGLLLPIGCAAAAAVGALTYLWDVRIIRIGQLPPKVHALAFPGAILLIGALAAVSIGAFAWLLRGVQFGSAQPRGSRGEVVNFTGPSAMT